ncbi:MAG: Rho termination factor N-terminal domain-containing protein [Firmicutes bacterium]|nr:Rho termination factor N-terminal domain-containing protein [Bacillota bacterium]
MEKLLFKNNIVNIVVGVILTLFTILAYFLGWIGEFLAIFIGIILIALSLQRFIITFKKVRSRNATAVLMIEIILDLLLGTLLIITQKNAEIYIGLILFLRGFSYLIINYLINRPIKFIIYLMNILFLTVGCFFMFRPPLGLNYLEIAALCLFVFIGLIYIIFGILYLNENKKKQPIKEELALVKQAAKPTEPPMNTVVKPTETPKPDPKPEVKIETPPKPKPIEPAPVVKTQNLTEMTVSELKAIAKEKNIYGYSKMVKSELIAVIRKTKS